MINPFDKSFDDLLEEILTDWQNQDPSVDVSQASPNYIKSACLASALWGLHRANAWLSDQIFPDTAAYEQLVAHAAMRQLQLDPAATPAEILAAVLEDIRRPPAGGNKYDYVRWAKQSSPDVSAAWYVPMGQGPGTVDVIILADVTATGSEIPDADLLATVRAYIVDICPGDVKYLRVLAPEVIEQDVTIVRTAASEPVATAEANITNYLAGFSPGQTLYRAQLAALALGSGSGGAEVSAPAADVVPTSYQMIRPGVIDVA